MPVAKIERLVAGVVTGRVERGSDGFFACDDFGSNVAQRASQAWTTSQISCGHDRIAACA
ncbi:hypothetical protein NKJ95_23770 [Mesorhizobium sp. M0012]|uniref:hypothetical protein n=1 Tax=Mesorhizobium sp. M0012 TaxID=2956840 RepID=UPI00333D1530